MKLTFIMPSIGRKEGEKYLKSWQMEPLPIAQLAGLTPSDVETKFFDDRFDIINYEEPTDAVAITVETYTAKRAYEIARQYRERGVIVIMGGFHPTLFTEEVSDHADIIVQGEAEGIWLEVISDIKRNSYKKIYRSATRPSLNNIRPNREIFKGKKYLPISLVESGRGCRFACNFCSVTTFYNHTYNARPVKEVIQEIKDLKKKFIFIVDDNIFADINRSKELFRELAKLNINWVGQVSINIVDDEKMLDLMKKSGCLGVLIGFESLNKKNLAQMNKGWNQAVIDYDKALKKIRDKGFVIYASFVFGYDEDDDDETFQKTLKFALKQKFFIIASNHLVPFPGTPLYEKFKSEGRLVSEKWWLRDGYSFGDVVFHPKKMTAEELTMACYNFRKEFYSIKNIFKRSLDLKANCRSLKLAVYFFYLNFLFRKEINKRKGIPLGKK
ncbi:MAG: radical SAM protein [Candidatus Parcubacteria bacterium]|nr:radical SAM protein [Candidatus Parcubacteria bacterium]